jgi:hypothetical protein
MISVMPPHRSDSTLTVAILSESTLSDKEVVARVLVGETECYAILVRRHDKRLYPQKQISRIAPSYTTTIPQSPPQCSIRRSGVDAKLGESGLKHDVTSGANSPYVAIRALRA